MDKIKITSHQLFSLTANGAFGGAVLLISTLVAGIAKQDAWIAALLTPVLGVPVIVIYCFLGSRYPDLTFIGIMKKIFGKWIGTIVAINFVFTCLDNSCGIIYSVTDFLTTQAIPETPQYVISLFFTTAVVIAVLYGIETIARASELFLLFTSVLILISMILVLPNAKPENLQPVFEKGIIPVLKGTTFLLSAYTFPLISLLMIYPIHLNNLTEAVKSLVKGYLWSGFLIFAVVIVPLLVLGSGMTAALRYPGYIVAKEINIGTVFSRVEFVIDALWLTTQLVLNVLLFYGCAAGLSELFGLKDYKRIVIPLGLIVFVVSGLIIPDVAYEANYLTLVWIPHMIISGLIIPVLSLVVFGLKKWI